MTSTILALNAGSSSYKFCLYKLDAGQPRLLLNGVVGNLKGQPHLIATNNDGRQMVDYLWGAPVTVSDIVEMIVTSIQPLAHNMRVAAIGHRVVHGGRLFKDSVLITPSVLTQLESLYHLAPLHMPDNIQPMRLLQKKFPDAYQIACFDTTFHQTLPETQQRLAIPASYHAAGVQRYGFHGLSYQSMVAKLRETLPAGTSKVIALHLGSGCSGCAIQNGQSLATTTAFSTLDGIIMASRPGRLDAGVVLHWLQQGLSATAIEKILYTESGLLGLSGSASDLRALLASDKAEARLAVDCFVQSIVQECGALAAMLGGVQALVFSGGIGENSAAIRARVVERLGWMGLALDEAANNNHASSIGTEQSRPILIIPSDEEKIIAHECVRLLKAQAHGA